MTTLLALVAIVFAGAVFLAIVTVAGAILKFAFHVVLLPLKLLAVPLIAIFAILKVVMIVTLITVSLALLIPVLVIGGLCLAPFAVLSALV